MFKIIKRILGVIIMIAVVFIIINKFWGSDGVDKAVEFGTSGIGAIGKTVTDHSDEINGAIDSGTEWIKSELEKGKIVDQAKDVLNSAKELADENGYDEKVKEAGAGILSKIGDCLKESFNFAKENGNVIP